MADFHFYLPLLLLFLLEDPPALAGGSFFFLELSCVIPEEKISMLVGQLQLSILNLENYVQKLEEQIRELKNKKN
jgi:cell shape-determining protein MreC